MSKPQYDDAPAGWALTWSAGWPTRHPMKDPSNEPRVTIGNVTVPARFCLLVAPDPKVAGDGVLILLNYLAAIEEIRLTDVTTRGIEVPQALDLLRKERPMEWWKRYAFVRLVFDEPVDDADLTTTMIDAFNVPITQRRKRMTDSHLAKVAEVYRVAWQDGSPPTKAVAAKFSVSHSTAARWVGAARKAGHLGPADSSRGGERPPMKQPTKRGKS